MNLSTQRFYAHKVLDFRKRTKTVECSASEAMKAIKSGDKIFVHSAAAAPSTLIKALLNEAHRLQDVQLFNLHIDFSDPDIHKENFTAQKFSNAFYSNCFFVNGTTRASVSRGQSAYIPMNLSQIPDLFHNEIKLNVALLNVSPPDKNGFCSLGVSVDVSWDAAMCSDIIIAQINPNMPRSHGDGVIHVSSFDYIVPCNEPLPESGKSILTEKDILIGNHCASLIDDGATLQMGIGTIPDAVLACLSDRKDLGIHTEMFSNGILDLFKKGAINNSKKVIDRGVFVTSFVVGDRELYDFIDDNIEVRFKTSNYANNIRNINLNPKVVAINSALEVDLSGQVCADSVGHSIYSGSGGQLDFARGSVSSEGGKFIIAMHSTTARGKSKICTTITPGGGIVTPRTLSHYVVTEYGIANLFGKNIQQRAAELIRIAHPDHRETLEKEFTQLMRWEVDGLNRWSSLKERRTLCGQPLHNE